MNCWCPEFRHQTYMESWFYKIIENKHTSLKINSYCSRWQRSAAFCKTCVLETAIWSSCPIWYQSSYFVSDTMANAESKRLYKVTCKNHSSQRTTTLITSLFLFCFKSSVLSKKMDILLKTYLSHFLVRKYMSQCWRSKSVQTHLVSL